MQSSPQIDWNSLIDAEVARSVAAAHWQAAHLPLFTVAAATLAVIFGARALIGKSSRDSWGLAALAFLLLAGVLALFSSMADQRTIYDDAAWHAVIAERIVGGIE